MVNYDTVEKDKPFKTTEGAYPDIRVNVLTELPADRRRLALERLRRIVETTDLSGYDCNVTGCKGNECTWGACQENRTLWPDPQDYIWPHDEDRPAPVSHPKCPMDSDPETDMGNLGCFHRCRFFQGRLATPSREGVLARIDELIKELDDEQV